MMMAIKSHYMNSTGGNQGGGRTDIMDGSK